MTEPRARTRLTPEARRCQLLDTAKQMVVDDGLQGFTMEGLARAAGVSSPLVYNYFPSRQALLRDLLQQEYERFARKVAAEVRAATDFGEVVRVFVASNFDHYAPGNVLPILNSQPEIAEPIQSQRAKHQRRTAQFLVRHAAERYELSRAQGRTAGQHVVGRVRCRRRIRRAKQRGSREHHRYRRRLRPRRNRNDRRSSGTRCGPRADPMRRNPWRM